MIEREVLKKFGIKHSVMSSQQSSEERVNVAERFNTDSSIRILLLSTQVGSLGLNLTGADTVIFMEHDWNPFKDIQAIDRAHRIGQKRVVTVYRMITVDSIESKIMNLQSFKRNLS